ncbi:nuclear transport factor 2 family protein [Actomonas aquatica]|uniref:Nuclear transport factor 2 family protein n=1 Tax=Actomonas aquatica TaxID=2866162 RepID=A0ABZ1C2H3_9BACT|nr:nuclear transport factor 2 family protein [Opitutus sp. WL0086]WRQ85780.1 nuclear transport factor 2 family protein [Opitutus sp. WL0086]
MNTNPTHQLPSVVARYFEAANRFDPPAAAACFTPDAVVHDEQQRYVGPAAIERWVCDTSRAHRPQVTVTRVRTANDFVRIEGTVSGDFPGSPVALDYELRLQDGKIAQLDIS